MSQYYQDQNFQKLDASNSYLNQDDGVEMEPSMQATPNEQSQNELSPENQNPYADRNFSMNPNSQ